MPEQPPRQPDVAELWLERMKRLDQDAPFSDVDTDGAQRADEQGTPSDDPAGD